MTGRVGGNGSGPRDALPPATCSSAAPTSLSDTTPPASETPSPATDVQGPHRRVIRVINPLGLHHRVADRFARTAKQYACSVTVWNGESRADGKSLWDLILLVVLPDTDVILEVEGTDAHKAVEPLTDILASPGGEDYTI